MSFVCFAGEPLQSERFIKVDNDMCLIEQQNDGAGI